jgi:chromosome partitioning protein
MSEPSDHADGADKVQGERLRSLRLGLRLSQAELKDELNRRFGRSYDKPRISRWENGREPVPEDVIVALKDMKARRPRDAQIIVLANQKGGVGKTTSALNLSYALARSGRRVCLIDMDPQATATMGLLTEGALEAYRQGRTMAHVILGNKPLPEIIVHTGEEFASGRSIPFDLAPSHIDLSETDGRREPGFDVALREALEPCRKDYDFIIIDAPPNLGMLTWMALAAADEVIIPVRTEPYDTMGVGLILGTINKVQRRLNPSLRLAGILPTQYGSRKLVDKEVLLHLIMTMGNKTVVLEPVPNSAIFGHAARNGRIALEASPSATAVLVYLRIAEAIVANQPLPRADAEALEPAETAQ